MSRVNIRLTPSAPNTAALMVNVAVTAAAQTLAAMGVTLGSATRKVEVQLENDSIRYCPDGKTPTPGSSPPLGLLMQAGEIREFSRAEAQAALFIRNNAGTACSLQVYQKI